MRRNVIQLKFKTHNSKMIENCPFIALHVKVWKLFCFIRSPPKKRFVYLILNALQVTSSFLCCFFYSDDDLDPLFAMSFLSLGWTNFLVKVAGITCKAGAYEELLEVIDKTYIEILVSFCKIYSILLNDKLSENWRQKY